VILFLGTIDPGVSSLRARRRSLNGELGISECNVGGEGSWLGVVSMLCRARHVERRVWAGFECEEGGGERGGEAKRADWWRVFGAEVVSQVSALGSNIFAAVSVLWCFVIAKVVRMDSTESR
jgi:hypothetical protein